jgi:hypothetical protein
VAAVADIKLKNGVVTRDARLDRIPQSDVRNSEFPVRALLGSQTASRLRTYSWQVPLHLDQGVEGQCVAYGIAHHLISRPRGADLVRVQQLLRSKELYWGAQQRDPWPGGSYPGAEPAYDGTSVLAGVQQAKAMGLLESYHWATSERQVAEAVAWHSPVIIGVNWYAGMEIPDAAGYITPTGELLGGHCTLVTGINVTTGTYRIHNSWGEDWGRRGDCYIRRRDLSLLLQQPGAEMCIPVKAVRRSPVASPLDATEG